MQFLTLYEGGPRKDDLGRSILGTVSSKNEPFCDFTVYGLFLEPTKKTNFVVIRMSSSRRGRNWRKLVQAIRRLVRPWFSEEQKHYDRVAYKYGKREPKECSWDIDGEGSVTLNPDGTLYGRRLWSTRVAIRFQWDGKRLVYKRMAKA